MVQSGSYSVRIHRTFSFVNSIQRAKDTLPDDTIGESEPDMAYLYLIKRTMFTKLVQSFESN